MCLPLFRLLPILIFHRRKGNARYYSVPLSTKTSTLGKDVSEHINRHRALWPCSSLERAFIPPNIKHSMTPIPMQRAHTSEAGIFLWANRKYTFLIRIALRLAAIRYKELSYLADSNFGSHHLLSICDLFLMRTSLWDLVFEVSSMQTGQQNWGFSEKIEHHWLGASRLL